MGSSSLTRTEHSALGLQSLSHWTTREAPWNESWWKPFRWCHGPREIYLGGPNRKAVCLAAPHWLFPSLRTSSFLSSSLPPLLSSFSISFLPFSSNWNCGKCWYPLEPKPFKNFFNLISERHLLIPPLSVIERISQTRNYLFSWQALRWNRQEDLSGFFSDATS